MGSLPSSCASSSTAGISIKASGFPPVATYSCSAAPGAIFRSAEMSMSARADSRSSPPTSSEGSPARSRPDVSPVRTPKRRTMPSASTRRAANNSASAEDGSTHCMSSATTRTGDSSATTASRLSVAAHVARRSPPAGGPRASAPASAVACGSAIEARRSTTDPRRSPRPAYARSASDSIPLIVRTWKPSARSVA